MNTLHSGENINSREKFAEIFCNSTQEDISETHDFLTFEIGKDHSPKSERLRTTKQFTLSNVSFLGKTEFDGISFKKGFEILIGRTNNASIIFKNCVFRSKIKIRSNDSSSHQADPSSRKNLVELKFIDCHMINGGEASPPYIRVGHVNIEFFEIRNLRVPSDAEVNIGDCDFQNFTLSNVRNLGKLKLYKINANAKEESTEKFQIDNASIGDTDLQSVNLVSFKTRKIYDNILSGIDYTNVQWEKHAGKDIEVGECNPGSKTELAKKRDTYRVLKNVAQNNDDMPQAFKFYAKEMKYHWKLTNKSKNLGDADKFILWFNWGTSNFGQDWRIPVCWILFLGWVSYAGLLFTFNGQYNPELWGKFFVFLNPTHQTTFISDCYWNGYAYAIDFFFRIIEGALIYQAIQAFRRFSRKV